MQSEFKITEQKCKICMSPLRDQIDGMLSRELTRDDGDYYRYAQIVDWAAGRDLTVSESGLSRHRTNHQQPSLMAALDAQKYIDAVSAATGRKLSLHSALANVIVSKALRLLDDTDLKEVDLEKVMRLAVMAGRNAMHIEKAEKGLTKETVASVEEKLTKSGASPEAIALVKAELYGLT